MSRWSRVSRFIPNVLQSDLPDLSDHLARARLPTPLRDNQFSRQEYRHIGRCMSRDHADTGDTPRAMPGICMSTYPQTGGAHANYQAIQN
jgi:hypothetical protein